MREAMIICPAMSNDGTRSLWPDIAAVERGLVDAFGGCTRSKAIGRWRSPEGSEMLEDVFQIVAAYQPGAWNDGIVMTLARDFGRATGQEVVYVRYASGEVDIIDTKTPVAIAA